MKKTSLSITHVKSGRGRTLRLSKEAIRTLSATDLARAVGGSGCDTTSYGTEKQTQGISINCK